jgi:light-regulated signal transduction histidine kinase (bacteriophytochrome)
MLAQRNAELVAANADLETFGYSVSHDLGAPLRHIRGFIKLLQDSVNARLNEDELKLMETIHRSAQRMGQLIDALLSFARIGRGAVDDSPVSLDSMLKETLAELKPDFNARKIIWKIDPLPDTRGNQDLLGQVFFNLVSNAVKYTRPRETAHIGIGSKEGSRGEIVIYVSDNGVGFDPACADKLFGVFQRLHSEESFEGTGIGLANVRRIISLHGGRTWAEGKPDEGATFYFSLPSGEAA